MGSLEMQPMAASPGRAWLRLTWHSTRTSVSESTRRFNFVASCSIFSTTRISAASRQRMERRISARLRALSIPGSWNSLFGTISSRIANPFPTFVPDARLSVMNVGFVLLAVAASIAPLWACQLSAVDQETYRRAVSQNVPFPERRTAFERSIHACPDDPRLYIEFASLLVANRDFSAALPWIDKGLILAPADATLNLRKGEALVALSR